MENNANVETTGAEIQENTAVENQNTSTEQQENQGTPPSTEQQPTQAEIATAYLRENGFTFETIEDLKKTPEKIVETKEVNPYEGLIDDEDKAYFDYKKETGRSRKEFEALNSNLDELPRINLARERVRKETGLSLTNEQVDEYLADTLGIDLEDMSSSDQVKLAKFTKEILDEKKAEQEKYRKPVENKSTPANQEAQKEYVKLTNGSVMLKSDFEAMENNRLTAIQEAKEAVNSVTASSFKVVVNDNGTDKELNYSYEYSDEDRHSMVSVVSDIDGVMEKRYRSEKGFNHGQFAEDMTWSDPKFREKAIASIVHKAIAENTEEVMKANGNFNFNSNQPLQRQNKDGVKMVSVKDALAGNV